MTNRNVPVSWTPAKIETLLDLLVNDCEGVLTVDHAASSHGLPVVVRDGQALGAAEVGELTVANYRSLGHAPLTAEQLDTIEAARVAGYAVRVSE